jgi:superfamily II DNA or RNA helicase
MENQTRDSIQLKAKIAWFEAEKKNTIIVGTGGGKSKIALDIIKEIGPERILLLTNSEHLRDSNWKDEFVKFGMEATWEVNVTSECYQTVYKWKDTKWDLVIADEIDFAMSPQYQQFFANNEFTHLLGLTGFCTDDKRVLLMMYAPVCYEITTQELQEKSILNQSRFIFVEYPLLKSKTITQKKKDGTTFLVSENDQYKYYHAEFQKALIVRSGIARKYRLLNQSFEGQPDYKAADWKFISMASKRKSILNNLDSSIRVVKGLLELIHSKPGNKVLIFSAVTAQADKLPNPFHGKSDNDTSGIEQLNSGAINTLSVCKKVSRGVNLVGVNYLIKESFDSSETDFQQTHGRLMRLRPDQIATYIILIPFYEDIVKVEEKDPVSGRSFVTFKKKNITTQAGSWADKMMTTFTKEHSKTVTLDNTFTIPVDIFN